MRNYKNIKEIKFRISEPKVGWRHPGGKLIDKGASSLTDAELLAIIISTGTKGKTAEEIAKEILRKFGSYKGIANQPLSKFADFKGLGDVKVVEQLPIADIKKIPSNLKKKIADAYKSLLNEVAEGVFNEISADPNHIELDKIKPAKRKLDQLVMGEVYGLTEEQQVQIYSAVVDMVRSRLERSDSVYNDNGLNNINLNIIKENIIQTLTNQD